MKLKLLTITLLSTNLLLSNPIIGTWSLDEDKVKASLAKAEGTEQAKAMFAFALLHLNPMVFREDGSCLQGAKELAKCWREEGGSYGVYSPQNQRTVTIVPKEDQVVLLFSEEAIKIKNLEVTYNKVTKASQQPPSIALQQNKIYFSKEVNPSKNSGNSFLIFWDNQHYYDLSTDEYNHLSAKALKAHISGEKKLKFKKMSNMELEGNYYVKNREFYMKTMFGDSKIEMIDAKHIHCNGRDYVLVEE